MVNLSFLDYFFNVCQSVLDFLHICMYLLLMIAAIVYAIYKFDVDIYTKYIYKPLIKFIFNKEETNMANLATRGRRLTGQVRYTKWNTGSNRLPYFVKAVKVILKNFFNSFK